MNIKEFVVDDATIIYSIHIQMIWNVVITETDVITGQGQYSKKKSKNETA